MTTTITRAEEGARELALSRKREIEKLLKKGGGSTTAEAVLGAARSPTNPLHTVFTWDDGEAAERFRLIQAAGVLRAYRVYVTVNESQPRDVRVGILPPIAQTENTRQTRGVVHVKGKYRGLGDVLTDPELREAWVEQAKIELRSVRLKFRDCDELSRVWAAIASMDAAA